MSVCVCVPFPFPDFVRCEPIGFIDFSGFGLFKKAIDIMNGVIMVVLEKGLHQSSFTALMCFVCLRDKFEKFATYIPF